MLCNVNSTSSSSNVWKYKRNKNDPHANPLSHPRYALIVFYFFAFYLLATCQSLRWTIWCQILHFSTLATTGYIREIVIFIATIFYIDISANTIAWMQQKDTFWKTVMPSQLSGVLYITNSPS